MENDLHPDSYWKQMFNKEVPPPNDPDDPYFKKAQEAYERAHDIRKFEIELYWKRALYFWGFEAAFLLIFSAIITKDVDNAANLFLATFIALLALYFSLLWSKTLDGTKAWQENWENHIDMLEEYFSGNLYKTIIATDHQKFYSVSKINKEASRIMIIFWSIVWLYFLYIILQKATVFLLVPTTPLCTHVLSALISILTIFILCFFYKIQIKKLKTKFDRQQPPVTKIRTKPTTN